MNLDQPGSAGRSAGANLSILAGGSDGNLLDLPVELGPSVDLVLEEGEILGEHVPVFGDEFLPSDEGPEPASLGDPDGDEHPGSVRLAELGGIESVVLAVVTRPGGDQGGGNDVAVVAPMFDRSLKDVASTTCIVAAADFSVLGESAGGSAPRSAASSRSSPSRRTPGARRSSRCPCGHPSRRELNNWTRVGPFACATLSVACGSGTPATTGAPHGTLPSCAPAHGPNKSRINRSVVSS